MTKKKLIQQAIDAKTNDICYKLANAMWKNNCKGKTLLILLNCANASTLFIFNSFIRLQSSN